MLNRTIDRSHPCRVVVATFDQASVHLRMRYRGNLSLSSSSKLIPLNWNRSKPRSKRTERQLSASSLDVGGSVRSSKRTIQHGCGYSKSTRMPMRSRLIWRRRTSRSMRRRRRTWSSPASESITSPLRSSEGEASFLSKPRRGRLRIQLKLSRRSCDANPLSCKSLTGRSNKSCRNNRRLLLLLNSTQIFDNRQYAVPDDVFWIAREVKV